MGRKVRRRSKRQRPRGCVAVWAEEDLGVPGGARPHECIRPPTKFLDPVIVTLHRYMRSMKRSVLLVPDEGLYLAFRLPLILREAGYRVDALCLAGDSIRRSRYLENVTTMNSIDEQITYLLRHMAQAGAWDKLIVAKEAVVRYLVQKPEYAWILDWQPGLADPLVQNLFRDKGGIIEAAKAWGFPIPESRVCRTPDDLRAFALAIKGTVIVKPMNGSGGAGVSLMPMTANTHASLTFPLLAQQFIEGQMGVVEMFCSRGVVKGWLASETIAKTDERFGPSTARLFRYEADLAPIVECLACNTRFEGFCGFDWIREKRTGKPYVVEFHPRATSGYRFGRACGVSFSQIVAEWNDTTSTRPPQTQAPDTLIEAPYFSADLLRCLRQRDWKGLRRWLPRRNRYHDIYWNDPALLLTQCCQVLGGRR